MSPYHLSAQSRPQVISPGSLTQVPAPTVLVFTGPSYAAGSGAVNYVRSWEAQQPFGSEAVVLAASTTAGVHRSTQYVDGLGRPIEAVSWQMSGSGLDLVTAQVYDAFGREQYNFLPYEAATGNGTFQSTPFADQNTFYTNAYPADVPGLKGEQVFYGQTQFESSPLNRPLFVTAPGNSWTGRNAGIGSGYFYNDATDQVPVWLIGSAPAADANNIPVTGKTYAVGTLFKTIMTNEQGSQVIEYKDLEGQVVEKRVQVADVPGTSDPYSGWLVTMYVYDDLNNLRVVIPPKAVDQIKAAGWSTPVSLAILDGLCFRYEYDLRKRILGKKVPGAGWTWMVYDKQNRLVFSQDANMGARSEWATTLYDGLDRAVMTGMETYNGTQAQLQAYTDAQTVNNTLGFVQAQISGVSGIPSNLTVGARQVGVGSYQASNAISFTTGFTSEPGASFSTSITSGSVSSASSIVYANNPLPSLSGFIPLTESFYDDYTWGTTKTYSTSHNSQLDYGTNAYADALPTTASTLTRGLPTGTRVRVLEDSANLGLGGWLETANFYDDKGRLIQTESDNYKGGGDTLTERYDFTAKVVCSYHAHSNPQASTWIRVKTNMNYDMRGRVSTITKELNDNPLFLRTIVQYTCTRLGQLKTKLIGQKGYGNNTVMETQAYDYNIRGWLKGINRGYANPNLGVAGGGTWWGIDLSYDWGYDSTSLNGNISGARWRSAGNGEQRSYGYAYDRSNRLLYSDFNQLFGSSWGKSDPNNNAASLNIDFSSWMGDGRNYGSAYDDNGNILQMHQKGLLVNASQLIDNLTYNYGSVNPANQLQSVSDSVSGNDHLGDFVDGHTGNGDYAYDGNGNSWEDQNKGINWITYDHLNLPYQVAINPATGSKGSITYIYDALGDKLERRVHETPNSTDGQQDRYINTDYMGNIVYEDNVLQFISHEEGRVRPYKNPNGQVRLDTLEYDYFLKDHLGDTRMILTDEFRRDPYPMATMEPGDSTVENVFYANLDMTRTAIGTVSGYPPDNTTNPNAYVAAVGGLHSAVHIGPSITLKVMAQDTLFIRGSSWYNQGSNPASYLPLPVGNLMSALSTGLTGAATAAEGSVVLGASGLLQPDATNFINSQPVTTPTAPKAYLNWIFFDEQFRYVSSGSGSEQVAPNSGAVNQLPPVTAIAGKSGYVYIYMSNADSLTTVYFDNFQVTQSHGPLTEEDHYYPFGLAMAGISDRAMQFGKDNHYKYNKGSELEEHNFSDGSGLQWYDTHLRTLDPQLGVWRQIDPKPNMSESPYAAMGNNPALKNDPMGDTLALFRPDGSFWRFEDDGKKDWSGVFYQTSKTIGSFEEGGVQYELRAYSGGIQFEFNDPDNDVLAIKNGVASGGKQGITNIELMSDAKVDKQINASGVKDVKKGQYSYAYNQGARKMDYGVNGIHSGDLNPKTFYIREGVAYNVGDIGNYLWGRGMAYLGIPLGVAQSGAEYNNMVHGRNQQTPYYDFGPGTYGSPGFLDSPDDQRAIAHGYEASPPAIEAGKRAADQISSIGRFWKPNQ